MPFALLKYGLSSKYPAERHFPKAKELKPAYDVVIVGAGGHGLAAAYYLAKDWGITNVAVLDKGYLAGGNTARNTAIIRSNYLTPGGRALLRRIRPALSGAERGIRLQHPLFRARPFHARPYRCGDAHQPLARRGEQASGRRFRADLSRRDPPPLPVAQHVGGCALSRSWARSIIRPAPSRATTPSPGAMPAMPPSGAWRSTPRPKSPASSSRTAASRAWRPTAATSPATRCCRPSPAPAAASRRWRASACRSAPSRCRPASRCRSSPSSTRSSSRAACMSMSRSPRAASW